MNDEIRRRISARLAVKPHNAADLCQFYNHYKEDIPVLMEALWEKKKIGRKDEETKGGKMIKTVFVFPNGMVAVCDENGQQIPEYQGKWVEKKNMIIADSTNQTEFNPSLAAHDAATKEAK